MQQNLKERFVFILGDSSNLFAIYATAKTSSSFISTIYPKKRKILHSNWRVFKVTVQRGCVARVATYVYR